MTGIGEDIRSPTSLLDPARTAAGGGDPVTDPARPTEGDLRSAAEPERNASRGPGKDAGAIDAMERRVEREGGFGPQTPHHLDLGIEPLTPSRPRDTTAVGDPGNTSGSWKESARVYGPRASAPIGMHGAEHMVVDHDAAVVEVLCGQGEIAGCGGILADRRRGEHRYELHSCSVSG